MIGRRGFLASLLATATLDPERLLWVPSKKLISIPKPGLAFRKDAFDAAWPMHCAPQMYFFNKDGIYELWPSPNRLTVSYQDIGSVFIVETMSKEEFSKRYP